MNAAVKVNGREHPLGDAARANVARVLGELGLGERKGVAVAVNGEVIPRGAWSERRLAAGDEVLVIQATQGG